MEKHSTIFTFWLVTSKKDQKKILIAFALELASITHHQIYRIFCLQ